MSNPIGVLWLILTVLNLGRRPAADFPNELIVMGFCGCTI